MAGYAMDDWTKDEVFMEVQLICFLRISGLLPTSCTKYLLDLWDRTI